MSSWYTRRADRLAARASRAQLLDMLTKILARTAEIAAGQPEPLNEPRNRPARLDSLPQHT